MPVRSSSPVSGSLPVRRRSVLLRSSSRWVLRSISARSVRLSSSSAWNGLRQVVDRAEESARSLSATFLCAERKITGMSAVSLEALSATAASSPSSLGRNTSITIRSGWSARAFATPSAPSRATSTR